MKIICTITSLLFALLIIEANADEFRTWTSASGKHKTEARLLEVSNDGKTITLRKSDDKDTDVPLDKLSKEDQEYVQRWQNAKGKTVMNKPVLKATKNKSRFKDVFGAARKGTVEDVEYFIDKGADIHGKDEHGEILLGNAAMFGNLEVVKFLVSEGADIHAQCDDGSVAIHSAALMGHLEIVKFLVSKGADIHGKNNDTPPLRCAAQSGNLAVVEFLISNGAKIDAKDDGGGTPLHMAAFWGNLEIVEFLVEKGADVKAKTIDGYTPLHTATRFDPKAVSKMEGHTVYVEYFMSKDSRNFEVVKYLVSKGANINIKIENGLTLLHGAAMMGHLEVVEFLVSKGVNVNAKTKDGETPLQFAATNEIAEFLLSKGAKEIPKNDAFGGQGMGGVGGGVW